MFFVYHTRRDHEEKETPTWKEAPREMARNSFPFREPKIIIIQLGRLLYFVFNSAVHNSHPYPIFLLLLVFPELQENP